MYTFDNLPPEPRGIEAEGEEGKAAPPSAPPTTPRAEENPILNADEVEGKRSGYDRNTGTAAPRRDPPPSSRDRRPSRRGENFTIPPEEPKDAKKRKINSYGSSRSHRKAAHNLTKF